MLRSFLAGKQPLKRIAGVEEEAAAAFVIGAGGAGGAQDGFVEQVVHPGTQADGVFPVVADVEPEHAVAAQFMFLQLAAAVFIVHVDEAGWPRASFLAAVVGVGGV